MRNTNCLVRVHKANITLHYWEHCIIISITIYSTYIQHLKPSASTVKKGMDKSMKSVNIFLYCNKYSQ